MSRSWVVVVPVKRLDTAKSRLARDVGELRRDIALAMALDTISVTLSCPGVRVVVVTDDNIVAGAVRSTGAEVIADEPHAGINAALVHGARTAHLAAGVGLAAMAADLPALRRTELILGLSRSSLASSANTSQTFLRDVQGTGTTLYTAATLADFAPQFGPGSAAAHAAVARAISTVGLSSLRQDVDTIDDLRAAARLGLNPRTAAAVAGLGELDLGELDLGELDLGDAALRAIRPAS